MILGMTGSFCAGKDTAADYLVNKKGFAHRSLSDEIRRVMALRHIPETRENLIRIGTLLRTKGGNAVLAKRALKRCLVGKNYVITSIRHGAEVKALKKRKDFVLVHIDAPKKIRFGRMLLRKRRGDPDTFEKFCALEEKESQSKGAGQQLRECARLADITIMNSRGGKRALYKKIDELLKDIQIHTVTLAKERA